jgi:hypothetical protein
MRWAKSDLAAFDGPATLIFARKVKAAREMVLRS